MPRSISLLDRVLTMLEAYVAMNHPAVNFGPAEAGSIGDSVARGSPAETAPAAKKAEATGGSEAGEPNAETGALPTDWRRIRYKFRTT